ncbi:hypothetical protein [Tardiphaga sp. 42S5]|nr:hypothetical protein [Tardiphaga sp. 42S5]WPO41673.1 hypothetical protein SFY93_00400 [Tardiphaga sp. 42S5]
MDAFVDPGAVAAVAIIGRVLSSNGVDIKISGFKSIARDSEP